MQKGSVIEFALNGGIDTRTDEKFVQPPKALDLQNCVFTKDRTTTGRDGYSKLNHRDSSGTALSGLRQLDTRYGELVALSSDSLYSYSSAADQWIDKGTLPLWSLSSDVIADSSTSQTAPVSGTDGTIRVTAWYDNTNATVYYCVTEESTGQVLVGNTQLQTNATKPLVAATSTHVVVSCVDNAANSINLYAFSANNLTPVSSLLELSDLHADDVYDMVYNSYEGTLLVTYMTSVNHIRVVWRNSVGSAHASYAPLEIDPSGDGRGDCTVFIAMAPEASSTGTIIFYGGASELAFVWVSQGTNLTVRLVAADVAVRGTVVDLGGGTGASDNWARFVWEDSDQIIWTAVTTGKRDAGSASELIRGVSLWGHIARWTAAAGTTGNNTDEWILPVTYSSAFQSVLLLVDVNGAVVGRALPGVQNGHWSGVVLGHAQLVDSEWSVAMNPKRRVRVIEAQADGYTQPAVEVLRLNVATDAFVGSAQARDSLWVGGTSIWQYDSANVVEAGFWFFPEIDLTQWDDDGGGPGSGATIAANAPFTVNMSPHATFTGANTYEYYFCYEWTDQTGKRVQSEALKITFTNMADPQDTGFTVEVPALRYSRKTDVRIVAYRTHPDDSDGPAHRCSAYPSPLVAQNSTHADVTYTELVDDDDLKVGEYFYMSANNVANESPLATDAIVAHDDRLVYVNAFDRKELYFSNRPELFDQPAFSSAFVVRVPDAGGDITALGSLDSVLVAFKRDRVYVLGGEGPTNTGLGSYGVPQLVTSDTGCKDQRSVVRTPHGLMFQSDKGIYLIDRQLQLSFVGADATDYQDYTVRSSALLPDDNGIIFVTNDERTLYFDYEQVAWSTFTNHAGLGSVVIDDDYYYLRSDGVTVYKRDSSLNTDAGSPIHLVYETPWYRPEGAQRLWRCYQMGLLGNYISDHELAVDVYINYREYPEYRTTWDVSAGLNQGTWGGNATWGGGNAWGIPDNTKLDRVYQFEHSPKIQKVEAIKFKFTTQNASATGRGVEFSSIALDAGMYQGSFRLPSGKKV